MSVFQKLMFNKKMTDETAAARPLGNMNLYCQLVIVVIIIYQYCCINSNS